MVGGKNSTYQRRSPKSQLRALLVDDNEEILDLTKVYLRKEVESIKLEVTTSPKEALEKLETENFDAVVSDYWMPDIDGLELLETIRDEGKDVPFILFTGKGDEEIAMEAINNEANGYISKKSNLKGQIKDLAHRISKLAKKKSQKFVAEGENIAYKKSVQETSMMGQLAEKTGRFTEDLTDLREILSILSKDGSLKIIESAQEGIRSSRGSWQEFGLSKRQYYSRLNSLKEKDLIKKEGELYTLTSMGEKLLNVFSGLDILTEISGETDDLEDPFEMVDDSSFKDSLFGEELSSQLELGQAGFVNVTDYDGFVDEIVKMIEEAEEEIRFASSFTDQRILRGFRRLDEDVDLNIVVSKDALTETREIVGGLLSSKEVDNLNRIFKNSTRRCRKIPFTFMLQDSKWVNLEIKNPLYSGNFFHGFLLKGTQVHDSFLGLFDEIYKGARKVRLLQ